MTRPSPDNTRVGHPHSAQSSDEIRRLQKVIAALMDRAERSMDHQGSDFGLFQTALTLEGEINQRTRELGDALAENEKITQDLYQLTDDLQAEIQQRRRADALRAGQYDILEKIAANVSLDQVLSFLAEWVENQGADGLVSLLVLADDGKTIAQSLSPSLPEAYNQALIGIGIGPNTGSCGTAMYRNEAVGVYDIDTDPLWADYRSLAAQFGLRACWSTPITTSAGQVLGSFATYFTEPKFPSSEQQSLMEGAVHLAGIAIERAQTEARIRYMAHHDDLTGLPNRALLQDRITQTIEQARREAVRSAVLMIDLDRFKHVNDSLGHHTGDLILQEVAQRLKGCVRASDTIARLGGDEFVINISGVGHDNSASAVAAKVMRTLETPFSVQGRTLQLGASIGISQYPEDGTNANDLLRTADTAMYAAKRSGRNQYHFFTHELSQAAHDHIKLLSQLQSAIRRQEFELYYQPLFRLADAQLVGAEALLRWQHPERGLLAPDQFLAMLEEHGLMIDVGTWVLRAACAQAALWRQRDGMPIRVSVNLATDQFHRSNLVEVVHQALADAGLESDQLMLEFTETVLLRNTDSIIATMRGLKKMGVRLSLDDFGTGYSSLSYLHSFPVDQLKIDQSFIQDINQQPNALSIVEGILGLASSLGIQSVAEGIEAPAQITALKALQCEFGQGYYLGRPMAAHAFTELLATQSRKP